MEAQALVQQELAKGAEETRVKYLYFLMTCIGCITSVVRSDYNFAFGLLGYYMVKNSIEQKLRRTALTVSVGIFLNF